MQMSLLGIGLPDVKMRLFLLKMSLLSLFFFSGLWSTYLEYLVFLMFQQFLMFQMFNVLKTSFKRLKTPKRSGVRAMR